MNDLVKQGIDARYASFKNSYIIKDDNIKKRIDDLFQKINFLAEECKDNIEFETKFASSPLNREYIGLFTEIASKCEPIKYEDSDAENIKTDKEYLMDEVSSDAKYIVSDLTMPARRKARAEFDSKLRDTPLGKIEQISNTAGVFRKLFKK